MSAPTLALNKLAEMRTAFDRTYAVPPPSQSVDQKEDLLQLRLAGNPYALRTSEISAFARAPKTIAVPSPAPELEGVAGNRGGVVPIYSLSAIFGYGREQHGRWCALCLRDEPIGFVFGEFEGYVRVVRSQIYAGRQEDLTCQHVKQVIRTGEILRPIVSLPSIVELIKKRCGRELITKEKGHVDIR